MVICDKNKINRKGYIGAPDLVIEILSPSTASKDTKEKYEIYQSSGVKEYWMVFPDENIFEVFILDENSKYQLGARYSREDTIHVEMLGDLKIELVDVFEEEFLD